MTRIRPLLLTMAIGSTAFAGCDADIHRVVTLEAQPNLPEARASLVGTTLRVSVDKVEEFSSDSRLTAWARDVNGWNRLGPVALSGATVFDGAAIGIELDSLDDVAIGLEPSTQDDAAPSSDVYFRGPPVGQLLFGGDEGPRFEDFEHGTMTAELDDRQLSFAAHALPSLPDGTSYAIWILEAAAMDGVWDEGTLLGEVESGEMVELEGDEVLATHRAVAITVEFDNGTDEAASLSTIAYGEVPPEPDEDGPEEEGGHLH